MRSLNQIIQRQDTPENFMFEHFYFLKGALLGMQQCHVQCMGKGNPFGFLMPPVSAQFANLRHWVYAPPLDIRNSNNDSYLGS